MKVQEAVYYKLPITDWPESDRPREKLMNSGAFKLSDTELLAIIIRTGSGYSSAIDLARQLIQKAGGFSKLARMKYNEIHDLKVKGVGITKAVTIVAAMQIARRLQSENQVSKDVIIKSSEEIAKIYSPRLCDLKKEIFLVILLASNNKFIKDAVISEGTINSSVITPREVFHEALISLAASIILIHNHPSGNLKPSSNDINFTGKMVSVGKSMNIPILDHIIIAGNKYTSFADEGLI